MIGQYDLLGSLRMIRNLILTKIFFPQARIIRFPFDIRNKKHIHIGNGLTTGYGCRIEAHPLNSNIKKCLIFGTNIELNDYVHIAAGEKIIIGNNVLIASKVFISDINHGNYTDTNQDNPLTVPNIRKLSTKPLIIEDNVWIGESVSILPGVTIGKGSIIGANSLVSKSVPPFSIAVGNPARVIKQYDFNKSTWNKQ